MSQKVPIVLLGIEVIAVIAFAWRSWLWFGWKKVGPAAFSGSPDESCRQAALSCELLLLGVWICTVGYLAVRWRMESNGQKGASPIDGVLIGLPVLAWAGFCLAGAIVHD